VTLPATTKSSVSRRKRTRADSIWSPNVVLTLYLLIPPSCVPPLPTRIPLGPKDRVVKVQKTLVASPRTNLPELWHTRRRPWSRKRRHDLLLCSLRQTRRCYRAARSCLIAKVRRFVALETWCSQLRSSSRSAALNSEFRSERDIQMIAKPQCRYYRDSATEYVSGV